MDLDKINNNYNKSNNDDINNHSNKTNITMVMMIKNDDYDDGVNCGDDGRGGDNDNNDAVIIKV